MERTAFKEVGSGVLDWKKARRGRLRHVQHYFVEQDQLMSVESPRGSYQYVSAPRY